MQERLDAVLDARRLAHHCQTAVLSTLSVKLQGHPFGSVSPVMLTDEGDVVFYVSDIAQHARNLTQDPRLSVTLFQQADSGDQNENGRLTLSGEAHPLEDNDASDHEERYFRLFPDALGYKEAHDFRFWRLKVKDIRFIGGFGKIFWLKEDEWKQPSPEWAVKDETGMVEHMNEDHADACQLIIQDHFGLTGDVTMLSVYPDGAHFMLNDQRLFVPFSKVCKTGQEVRQVLVALTHKARAAA